MFFLSLTFGLQATKILVYSILFLTMSVFGYDLSDESSLFIFCYRHSGKKLYLFTAMLNRVGPNKTDIAVSLRYSFRQQMCLAKNTI